MSYTFPFANEVCVKSVRIWSYSGPHFPAFGMNTERYEVSLGIQSECEKMRTRITPNTDTFYVMKFGINKELAISRQPRTIYHK